MEKVSNGIGRRELADMLGIRPHNIGYHIKRNALKAATNGGGVWMVDRQSALDFVKARLDKASAEVKRLRAAMKELEGYNEGNN